ncbi:ABC-type transporter, integral membrane subunit [Caldithrix abyssi DSM 13497]|uniref:ABC-type transporter, integral membrane subunit n=3 Tax=Caldithrix abyssi TaxID=187145 RepID=H1XT04_CALAY|nr:metal ABC transporter permease [Caldithrix abyssi]EHO41433.1 ABC-type transporter, integral membrane subunit [Caldithrix abyssi DSM 13497]
MHLSIWDIMAPAFFECLILVGIHSYLGIHVIKRKVIFVDLALAQVAALGTTVGFLFGIMPGTSGAYWFSLGFAIIGAAIFSLSRFRHEKIPQEAIIGLVYALAAAIAILVIDKAPHGAEHIKELLTGSILWVKWKTIFQAALVYLAVGVFHFIFREKFLLISNDPEKAYESGLNVRLWDFLFYVSFGVVITHSVGTAGVLLVFVFLVVPAITSIMITDVLWKQLLIGWSMGLLVSVLGLYFSYIADLPSGPTIVTLYGLMLFLVALILYVIKTPDRGKAMARIGLGIVATILVVLLFRFMGQFFHNHEGHAERQSAATLSSPHTDPADHSAAQASLDSLLRVFTATRNLADRFEIAKSITEIDRRQGLRRLIKLLKECPYPFLREEIFQEILRYSKQDFGYDSMKDFNENRPAFKRMEKWLHTL